MAKRLPQDKIDSAKQLKAEGKTNHEIAVALGISLSSVDKYCGSRTVEEYNRYISFANPSLPLAEHKDYMARREGYESHEAKINSLKEGLAKLVEENQV